jgi:succinoglycan biosynthesis transport protein ExoP
MVFGCIVALIRDRMERTLRSESDVRAILDIRCAGMVPRLPRDGSSLNPLSAPIAVYTEAIRSIMVSLQLSWPRLQTSRVILVTSSVPDEGKSTLASSLAYYATRAGARVLLLDLDIGGAATAEDHLDRPNGTLVGLLERDRIPIDTIRTADGTEFDYLPVRRGLAGDPLPLFSPSLVSEFLRRLRSSYDYIIVDSAPVLVVAEARFMAALSDRILFVVRWGKTRRNEARRALELLRHARGADTETTNLISAVITRVDLKKHARRHYSDEAETLARYTSYYIAQRTR